MKAPSGEASDSLTAYETTSVLVVPEKAKNFRSPKCISHKDPFAVCEVGFVRGIIRVGFASHFNVSLMGVREASSNRSFCGVPSLSYDSPKKVQSRPRWCSKYFSLIQPRFLFRCLLRAHCHKLEKMA